MKKFKSIMAIAVSASLAVSFAFPSMPVKAYSEGSEIAIATSTDTIPTDESNEEVDSVTIPDNMEEPPEYEISTTSCKSIRGDNIGDNNYTIWSSPVYSYLEACSDGSIMRVQGGDEANILIEYYNSEYKLQSSKEVSPELPLFGAFYATDNNYYILSGQNNRNESSDVECFRLTKYDKSWNRISSVGLYDCNTYRPFEAGSARIAELGKYLVIRTCHTMYKMSDGYHHQANVTIQVDTDSMTVTDSYTGVMNVSVGYVSHSFNQFVQADNGHIVAADHGDAYPRGIVLQRYEKDSSTGEFAGSCDYTKVLNIYGSIDDNATKASLGGMEISSTSYITVGNSVEQTSTGYSSNTRNIFVAAVPKSGGIESDAVDFKWITSYKSGEDSATTPQLVKLNDNRFMLLWSQGDNVYYTKLDAEGNQVGEIKSLKGKLSDCVPTVVGNKVVWYTYSESDIKFYEISFGNGIYIMPSAGPEIIAGLVSDKAAGVDYEYSWFASRDGGNSWIGLSDWTLNNEWISWRPSVYGDYILVCKSRIAGQPSSEEATSVAVAAHPYLKGICQLPYEGEGGGYLIGMETYDNQDYSYEMLILDCTLYAQGKPAWVYSTGKCKAPGNCLWTVWQPQYGYYWTLFRIFDKDGNMIDEQCYGFQNIG